MPNFAILFDLNFWFSLQPNPLGKKGLIFVLSFFIVLIVASIVFNFLGQQKGKDPFVKNFYKKLFRQFLAMGLLGLFLLFLSYEQIYILGSYFWYIFWFLGFVAWSVVSIRYFIVRIPENRKELEKKKKLNKYLT